MYRIIPWTKTEYKKALAREQSEQRTVMLPLIVGQAEIPDFLEDRLYIDLRNDFFTRIFNGFGMIHGLSRYRLSRALSDRKPTCVRDVWDLPESIGFDPYVVLGEDDVQEILQNGGAKSAQATRPLMLGLVLRPQEENANNCVNRDKLPSRIIGEVIFARTQKESLAVAPSSSPAPARPTILRVRLR